MQEEDSQGRGPTGGCARVELCVQGRGLLQKEQRGQWHRVGSRVVLGLSGRESVSERLQSELPLNFTFSGSVEKWGRGW